MLQTHVKGTLTPGQSPAAIFSGDIQSVTARIRGRIMLWNKGEDHFGIEQGWLQGSFEKNWSRQQWGLCIVCVGGNMGKQKGKGLKLSGLCGQYLPVFTCIHVYVYMFISTDLPPQQEREVGWGHWCYLSSSKYYMCQLVLNFLVSNVVQTGICVHVLTGKCVVRLAASWTCGQGSSQAASFLLDCWIWPPPAAVFWYLSR